MGRESMKEAENWMEVAFEAKSENESLARMIVGAFLLPLNPTVEEVEDVKTATCEAVTNAIIHGYEEGKGTVYMKLNRKGNELIVHIEDEGIGIRDIGKAMEPLYTSKPELERSGMGFTFMEAFMDEVLVESIPGKWTKVHMKKILKDPFERA